MSGCTGAECFSRMLSVSYWDVWKKRVDFVLERDYHLQRVVFVCVCCRQQHSSPFYVCEWVRDVYVFSSIQVISLESITVICVSLLGCVMFLCLAAGSTPMEQDGWLAGLFLIAPDWDFIILSKSRAAQYFDSPRHICLLRHFPHCAKSLDSAQGLQHRVFFFYLFPSVHLIGTVIANMHTPSSPPVWQKRIFNYIVSLLKGRLQDHHTNVSVLLHKQAQMHAYFKPPRNSFLGHLWSC